MPSVSYGALLADARLYCDERPGGTDAYVKDAEGIRLCNAEIRKMIQIRRDTGGHEWDVSDTTFSTAADQVSYALPADHAQTLKLQVRWADDDVEDIFGFEPEEQERLRDYATWGNERRKGFRLNGTNVEIWPKPDGSYVVAHRYVQLHTDGTELTDTWTYKIDGEQDVIALGVAAKMNMIQRLDTTQLKAERNEHLEVVMDKINDQAARQFQRRVDVAPETQAQIKRWYPTMRDL